MCAENLLVAYLHIREYTSVDSLRPRQFEQTISPKRLRRFVVQFQNSC